MRLPIGVKQLLWDVDIKTIDVEKHQSFLITRLAEKGGLKEIQWLRKTYGDTCIARRVAVSKNVSKKTKNFWKTLI
ncbi:MAG: hypothetical protein HYV41_04805 [Candidatus Magasanikbacteria bacterium]|nr:hypothetical protein [Candidatus Magasanikbacteria bacterium]